MITRIFFLLAMAMLPVYAQSSLNDGGRILPAGNNTVQPANPKAPATLKPGVDTQPNGVPAPGTERPPAPRVHCYIKEFVISPSTIREGPLYQDIFRTHITLNVPAPRRLVVHIVTSDESKITATVIVILKNGQSGSGGIGVIWKAIPHDTQFEFKAFLEDDPDLVLHSRVYVKKQPVE